MGGSIKGFKSFTGSVITHEHGLGQILQCDCDDRWWETDDGDRRSVDGWTAK